MPTGIQLSSGVVVGQPIPLDAKFGPYNSTTVALNDISVGLRYRGLTVGVYVSGVLQEYWFKDGTGNEHFVAKSTDVTWDSLLNKPSTFPPSTHTHADATTSVAGFLSTTDKTKLDKIAVSGSGVRINVTKGADITDEDELNPTFGQTFVGGSAGLIEARGGDAVVYFSGGQNGAAAGSINLNGGQNQNGSPYPAGSGGIIDLSGGSTPTGEIVGTFAGNAGQILMSGGNSGVWDGGHGGVLNLSGGDGSEDSQGNNNGGSINLSNGGGSIDLSNWGGSINLRGTGSIQFGKYGTRTTVTGTATEDRSINLPNESGTLALTGHTHTASEISDSTSFGRTLLTAATVQAQRTALDIFVSAANVAAFPASGNFQRAYLAQDTGKLYAWSGTAYFELSPFPPVELVIACSDEVSNLTAGTNKVVFRAPYAFKLTAVRASVNTAPTGSALIVNVKKGGTSVFSTKPQIDASAKTSVGSGTTPVISTNTFASDDEISIDIDQIGSTVAGKGLKVTLIGTRV